MGNIIRHFDCQLIEYSWGGHNWTAAAILHNRSVDVWIAPAEGIRDQARYAFTAHQGADFNLDEETITTSSSAIDAMFELANEYLLDIEEDAFEKENDGDKVFRFEFGPLSIEAFAAKTS